MKNNREKRRKLEAGDSKFTVIRNGKDKEQKKQMEENHQINNSRKLLRTKGHEFSDYEVFWQQNGLKYI